MNKMIAMGRITHDLELKTTSNGVPVLKFWIAVDRNYQKSGEEKKTDFFNVIAWRGTAEFISRYFSKGRLILIEGEMQTSEYTDQKTGNKAIWYEISADAAYFTGEKKDDAAQGYPVSNGSYQQSPRNYQPAAAPAQPAPNYQAQYGAAPTQSYQAAAPAPNYQAAMQNQQAADMAAIAAKYAAMAAQGTAAAAPPPAPTVPAQMTLDQNGQGTPQTAKTQMAPDVYPF